MLFTLVLHSVSIFTLGEHKYERIVSRPLISRPLVLTNLLNSPGFLHLDQQPISLIPIKMAEIHDIRPLDTSVFFDVIKHHLLLLNVGEMGTLFQC